MAGMQAGVELAGFGRRLGAYLIDLVWLLPLSVLLGLVAGLVNGGEISWGGEVMGNVVVALVVMLFWAERRATPGKLVVGVRIVDAATGGTPPLGRLALRYFGYLVSALPLGLGYLWMLWDRQGQTWHDKLGRTLVVRERR
ncbi:RDD family protein [Falsiroseomonas sp. CW058]|uniref:RDD family protein n=1 Tax=Falsiroseomonas sp. CW058 TaxID=3388664 RepID=UPI003D318672